jgi:hypothetical protein
MPSDDSESARRKRFPADRCPRIHPTDVSGHPTTGRVAVFLSPDDSSYVNGIGLFADDGVLKS